MGTILASTILTRVRGILQDSDSSSYTWSNADLLSYADTVQRNIVFLKPSANIVTETVQLIAGPKQTVTDGIGLVRLNCFMGTDGATRGNVIHYVPFQDMSYHDRAWMSATAYATPEIYTYDPDDPGYYYVYPPQPSSSTGYVEEVHIGLPATISELTDALSIADIYLPSVIYGVLQLAYAREVDPVSGQFSDKYGNLFLQSLGLKTSAEKNSSPKE